MMVEHNQSTYNGGQYNNVYKFNGKELDDATGMYYYGARYYDPRISIFVSVDPLAEQTMEPYLYTGNNPIMFTDPTGMSKEGLEHDPPKKEKARGEKILHFKQDGKDMSVHENDEGIIARTYRFGKAVKKWTEDKLTGGFYFYDENKTEGSGDQSLGRTWEFKNKEEKLNSVESRSAYQAASFAKVGEGIGSIKVSARATPSFLV